MIMKPSPVKLLLVDDRSENLFSLTSLLEDLGVEIFKAQSGPEALNLMLDHDFALALLDVQMPEMDGFELAELMRGAERTKSVPIIFVTAAAQKSGFAFRGYESGAVDFLYKPVDPVILRSKVKVFVELDQQKKMLKKQLDELKDAKESAETANRLKSAFLANMSHEIRTPLGALMGFAELLEDDQTTPEEKTEFLKIIKRSGNALVHLINGILDLSKVEAGHLEVENIPFSPTDLLNEVFDLLGRPAQKKGLRLLQTVEEKIPQSFVSDPTRLRQILMNVIGNAIKFTEAGDVRVTAKVEQTEGSRRTLLVFEVEDSGIGMTGEQAQRLFQPFMQADNSVTRKFGGTGLGLALSQRLAQSLGGEVVLKRSELGHGSVFRISVANRSADNTATKSNGTAVAMENQTAKNQQDGLVDLKGMKILVVDDAPENQFLIRMLLSRRNAKVDFAANGSEGVSKALADRYDVILMDIQMPIMDGYEAIQILRQKENRTPIIALTAHAMRDEREKCINAGCDDYLSKPIDQPLLLEKVSHYIPAALKSAPI